jgi:transposase
VKLSNPFRTRAIVEAKVKMDKQDAKTPAYLVRGDLEAESYVPTRKNPERRTLIRHRASLMKMREEVKNRIHMILDKYDLSYEHAELFGKEGLEWLQSPSLPPIDQQILQSNPREQESPMDPNPMRSIR